MCIIIDTNLAADVFNNPSKKENMPIVNWVFDANKDGILVFGGKLAEELLLMGVTSRALRALMQAGRAVRIDDNRVNLEEQQVIKLGVCQSNDTHVIALARISGARTLCSHDTDLHSDFKNKQLLDNPRGCVYQNDTHTKLLKHTSGCRRQK